MHINNSHAVFSSVSLAEAHAKLNLRTQVLQEDAVIAVLLCENSTTLKHGNYILYSKVTTEFDHMQSMHMRA